MHMAIVKVLAIQTQKLVTCMMVTVMSRQHDGHILSIQVLVKLHLLIFPTVQYYLLTKQSLP